MRVKVAKAIARQWVENSVSREPGFCGAFFHGSVNWLPEDVELAFSSDLDIMVVFCEPPELKLGKFIYGGVLLEVSYYPWAQLQSPGQILGLSHMAGSFKSPGIIADPFGALTKLQAEVEKAYTKRHWVKARCEHVQRKILDNVSQVSRAELFCDQVTSWLFGTGLTTHLLLAAGLKNPTVRKRYAAARELLSAAGHSNFYENLLDLLGCRQMNSERVREHLDALAEVFDAATEVITTPFFFASDISPLTRTVAIDGSRKLIEKGYHREAVFWIVATYSRCQKVFHHDAPDELLVRYAPGYDALLADLGIRSKTDLEARGARLKEFIPELWEVAEAIMDANPEIVK